jgi:hypothetical protein
MKCQLKLKLLNLKNVTSSVCHSASAFGNLIASQSHRLTLQLGGC